MPKSNLIELLAPVGNFDMLKAVAEAGADAVYFGGKRFSMRMHRTDANFDDDALFKAVEYAHAHDISVYLTVNNLISEREVPGMRDYLKLLREVKPDALIIQDAAVIGIAREIGLNVPLHASVMMNIHNAPAVSLLKEYGVTRVVAGRELTLKDIALLKEKTGLEFEYFIHGDMCMSHSGQCLHSGVIFAQSSNRGRCLKPCRWPYQLTDAATLEPVATHASGPYALALKDMCMYPVLPELIQSGVCSFKIEGRMRTTDFAVRIVRIYRKAIDRYLSDPTGYTIDQKDWQDLFDYRARDFSTCFAFGNPGSKAIGYNGAREPRFFSQAVREPDLTKVTVSANNCAENDRATAHRPSLAVRVADLAGLTAACQNGANTAYIAGDAFKPAKPWTFTDIEKAVATAKEYGVRVVLSTPRITMEKELGEWGELIAKLENSGVDALLVSNAGMLRLAQSKSSLPVQADFSFNIFNHLAVKWLQDNHVAKVTLSLEATYAEIAQIIEKCRENRIDLPLEVIVHGALETMVMEHCLGAHLLNCDGNPPCRAACSGKQYALLDSAGQAHQIKIDQYCRSHLLFANDLCLLPQLRALAAAGVEHYRIEGQHYSPEHTGLVTALYRQELDKLAACRDEYIFDQALVEKITASAPRKLGCGVFRHRLSK